MKVAVPRERRAHERRVAITPEIVKKLVALGASVSVETGAGRDSVMTDTAYEEAGARITSNAAETVDGADVVLKVQRPMNGAEANGSGSELQHMQAGQTLVAMLDPLRHRDSSLDYAKAGITAFAMELMPRITRAQSMDVLSSQANLAGYKAVLDGCEELDRAMPMMMTAAGTVAPARVFVLGAGVAGLQAIATARRLGAIVSATDVRPAAKEQVQSLGASFVMVDDEESRNAETSGGYAKEMSDAYKAKQAALVAEHIKNQDMVITTALIPGRPAPILVTEEMVRSMKRGSVVVDLAVESGGNCALSKSEEIVDVDGVKIIAHANVPSRLSVDASQLYARNLYNFVSQYIDGAKGAISFDWEDPLVKETCIVRNGEIVHPVLLNGGGG